MTWPLRAIQLDLARHRESVDDITRYADAAARRGFNTLVLYLEGRVRTSAFPYRKPEASYTLEDMARVVGHGRDLGMDVVPVVSTLGHAEQFLACPELTPLSEERDGRGRFGSASPQVFCPSQEETYAFFERYFSELATVFTGPHWHTGLDECWNLGYCGPCRERWNRDGLGPLFTAHVLRTHDLVRRLGKRMWMWDDFYELFPQELERLPKDVVMCHWGYDDLVEPEGQQAHFINRRRADWLGVYRKLGLDAIVCPVASYWNTRTFTDYARRHPVLGGLLTQWEGTPRFRPENEALVAFTGRLWSAAHFDPEEAGMWAVEDWLPGAAPGLASAALELVRLPRCPHHPGGRVQARWTAQDTERRTALRLALALLRRERELKPVAHDALDDLEYVASDSLLRWDLHELELAIADPRREEADLPVLRRKLVACLAEAGRLDLYWKSCFQRAGDPSNAEDLHLKEAWGRRRQAVTALEARLETPTGRGDWLLVLRLFLQDFHGAPKLKVTLGSGGESLAAAEGSFKHGALMANRNGGFYDIQVPFSWDCRPETLRLDGGGYGGQGVAYVQLVGRVSNLGPASIRRVEGFVSRPEAVLADDSSVAMLGLTDICTMVHHPEAGQPGVLELDLREL